MSDQEKKADGTLEPVIPSQSKTQRPGSDFPVRGFRAHARRVVLAAVLAGTVVAPALPICPSALARAADVNNRLAGAIAADVGSTPIAEIDQAIQSFASRQIDDSLKHFQDAVKAHPELPPAPVLLAKLALADQLLGLARSALERAAHEAPEFPDVYLQFGNLALLEGRVTDASLHFEKARSLLAGKGLSAEQKRRFEIASHQGKAAVAELRGDLNAARESITAWLALEPNGARARQRLGKALFGLKNYDEAYKELQQAFKDEPSLEQPALSMAWLYTRAGNLKKAEEWIAYAVKSLPSDARVHTDAAAWYVEQGRADDAKTQAEAAAKLDPKLVEAQKMLGLVARQRHDGLEAERVFQAMSLESPADNWARNQLALALAEQPDEAKRRRALELAELSVRQNPKAADALATLGTVYYRLKRLDDAEKVLQNVFESGKGDSDAAYVLALVAAEKGNADKAEKLMKTALQAPGLFIYRKDAQQWLERPIAPK
ncbi:MAG TPA: tetratricopeptide repeat protein [Isosphaeraceae bacterium]|nr:tetratricopeptide repeat protein [Isosphaeraceae bacterium]